MVRAPACRHGGGTRPPREGAEQMEAAQTGSPELETKNTPGVASFCFEASRVPGGSERIFAGLPLPEIGCGVCRPAREGTGQLPGQLYLKHGRAVVVREQNPGNPQCRHRQRSSRIALAGS